ncbi:hypothetical protein N4T42_00695 [Riemerella anatipestifer]|uniref:hypothetical protein n=1 Tax=Riemerella anatipestifer TaxID=34085 RepID=UPI001BD97129|nr:hypothetical protein [Riemerella anatipestifer]MBT0552619.1 hypothetical protein [Riemerella anatipestifer]MBT0552859.1 hypothetical protein [Riemerella anatipestifer]MCE3023595.1 hypothetical protein [Riemerella anatipestifer]MCU7558818.1 hypothetical protein [Riemerella anatipestifer]MDY3448261.1 hypothetical protein [Riemerella anatipestifer]
MNTKGNKMTSYDANEQNPFAKQVRRQVSDLIDDLEILRGAGKNKNMPPQAAKNNALFLSLKPNWRKHVCLL